MKKRNILVICIFLLVCLLVFLSGLLLHSWKAEQSVSDVMDKNGKTDGISQNDENTDDAAEHIRQQEEDVETVKKKGNMFEPGEYQSYGGFGYRVLDFNLYDSYDDMSQNPDYNSENEVHSPDDFSPQAQFVFVELEVTNESENDAVYYHPVDMYVTQDGKTVVDIQGKKWGLVSGRAYIGGVRRSANEVDKTVQSPFTALLSAGETIVLQYYFEVYAISHDEGEEAPIGDIYTDAEYLLQVSGTMTSGEPVLEPEKDGAHIYFICRKEGKDTVD